MPYLLRAINRENWPEPEENATINDLAADALNDLKTNENNLSFWYAENENEKNEAILAYLASMDRWVNKEIEEVEFIAINTQLITDANITISKTDNFTYVSDYSKKHRDLTDLTLESIEKIVKIIIISIKDNNDMIITRSEIEDMFKEALNKKLIDMNSVSKDKHGKLLKFLKNLQ